MKLQPGDNRDLSGMLLSKVVPTKIRICLNDLIISRFYFKFERCESFRVNVATCVHLCVADDVISRIKLV